MIVLITGIMRSGSTWSYNVALEILQRIGPVSCGYIEQDDLQDMVDTVKPKQFGVFKCHTPNRKMVDKIAAGMYKSITTIRHPLDCVASRQQFRPTESLLSATNNIRINVGTAWSIVTKCHAAGNDQLVIRYEEMIQDPRAAVQAIMMYLGVKATSKIVDDITTKTGIAATKQYIKKIPLLERFDTQGGHRVDPVTCLHDNHITDGRVNKYKDVLTPAQIKIARKVLEKEIRFLGYA